MGNEQSNNNQFNQNKGYHNNKKKSHSNHYHGHQFNNNNDYGHYEKKSQESDNYYGYEDDQNGSHQSDNNNGHQFNYNINTDYDEETEHPYTISGDDDAEDYIPEITDQFAKIDLDGIEVPPAIDRRNQATFYDGRAIIKCIGEIECDYGTGTATVFKVIGDTVYVMTAGHVLVKSNSATIADTATFARQARDHDKPVLYDCELVAVHEKMAKFCDQNDLAILKFQDKDRFYVKLFRKNPKIVHLINSDLLRTSQKYTFGVYGVSPGSCNKSRAKKGEIWGMERNLSLSSKRIRKDADGVKFEYTAFDTERGQSGSAIYISWSDGSFGIVGVHTGGNAIEKGCNWGTALNGDKIKWIQQKMKDVNKQSPQRPQYIIMEQQSVYIDRDNNYMIAARFRGKARIGPK